MKKSLLEVLKDLSALLVGAAAILYVFGFTVHWAYFRVLGVEVNGQPFDYLRFAADYATSIVSSIPQLLFSVTLYAPRLVDPPLLIATICCFIIVLVSPTLYVWRKKPRKFVIHVKKRTIPLFVVLWWVLSLTIILSISALLRTEFDVAKVRNILQPVDGAQIQEMQNQLSGATDLDAPALLELRSKNVIRVYEKYTKTQKDSPGFSNFNKWFNPTTCPNCSAERIETYLGLLLLNLVTLLAIIYQLCFLKYFKLGIGSDQTLGQQLGSGWSRTLIFVLSCGLLFQLLLFPFVYATLGRYFVYPMVRLKLTLEPPPPIKEFKDERPSPATDNTKSDDKTAIGPTESWTHCVYLIAQSDNEVIVYDRLNFFQIKHIPRTRLLAITEVFAASPFESCSKEEGKFTPCETLWMLKERPILDF